MSTIKYKVKTPTITTEFSGELCEGIETAFCSVRGKAARDLLLNKLRDMNDRITKHEVELAAQSE